MIDNDEVLSRGQLGGIRRSRSRWRILSLFLVLLLIMGLAYVATQWPTKAQADSAAAIVQAAENPQTQYANEQLKSENVLLRQLLMNSDEAIKLGRHHSMTMWDLLAGRIDVHEAWWIGGDSTCSSWLAANAYDVAKAKLKGKTVKPEPLPKEAIEFCKQARERK